MAITYTPRLQLAKPDADEYQLVSVLDSNSDLVDKYTNARIVADNVTPALNELYDGAFIHEKNSQRTWIAILNAGGTYDKHYLASATTLWQATCTAITNNLPNPGNQLGIASISRPTVAYNRLFHISWAMTCTAAADNTNTLQAEAWLNGNAFAYDRHNGNIIGTFSNEAYASVPAGTPAVFQCVVTKVTGTGVISTTNDSRFTHFQATEQAVA